MQQDAIAEIGIDAKDRLYVKPCSVALPYIYREAMEVHWDSDGLFLYSPKPREWSYAQWFKQIVAAAREQSCQLAISQSTTWVNIPASVQAEILAVSGT